MNKQLSAPFAYCYEYLRATPGKALIGIVTTIFLFALIGSPPPAHAATIIVDGDCTLVLAIENANDTTDGQPNSECASGDPSGADTIVLTASNYSYTTASGTNAALPNISSEIIIEGSGATLERAGGPDMRLLTVAGTGNLTLNNVTLTGGVVSGSLPANQGGGLYVLSGGIAMLNNSTISGNTTTSGNGGGLRNSGTLTLNNSTVSGNEGFLSGGGIANDGAVTLNNSTISSNTTSGSGGGIRNFGSGTVMLNNSTITDNTATNQGGGISSNGSVTTLSRTIIVGNTANSDGHEVHAQFASIVINANNYNVIGYGGSNRSLNFTPSGSDVVPVGALDTVLDTTLADNGGPTLTHLLVTGSPAIDIAPTADCNNAPINGTDQRGVLRSQDGNASGAAACDAGAIELGQLQCGLQTAVLPTLLTYADASGVLVNVVDEGTDLDCVRVTEIGHSHPHATSSVSNMALETGRYWQILGLQNNTSPALAADDFDVDLTLPFASADANSRVCKWLEGAGPGFGWACGPSDGTGTSYIADTSVTRTGLSSFSDWAVGDEVGPTAVTLVAISIISYQSLLVAALLLLLLAGSGFMLARQR